MTKWLPYYIQKTEANLDECPTSQQTYYVSVTKTNRVPLLSTGSITYRCSKPSSHIHCL